MTPEREDEIRRAAAALTPAEMTLWPEQAT